MRLDDIRGGKDLEMCMREECTKTKFYFYIYMYIYIRNQTQSFVLEQNQHLKINLIMELNG